MYDPPNQLSRVPSARGFGPVSTLITGEHLIDAIGEGGFIKNGAANCVEGAKYDFRMSPLILKSSYGGAPVNLNNLTEEQRARIQVEPGEVVFVRTLERLELPNNITAVLSTKRKLSHQGVIALGGFCIDPLYKGPLFIGLYNFSSTPFPLQAGKKLIAALFYELSGAEITDFPHPESVPDDDFPDELKNLIRNYKPVELKGLIDKIFALQAQFDALQDEVRDDKTWRRDFRAALEEQSGQIKSLLHGLTEEKEARKQEDAALRSKLENISSFFTVANVLIGIGLLILGGFLQWAIPKLFDRPAPAPASPPAITAPAPTVMPPPPAPKPSP